MLRSSNISLDRARCAPSLCGLVILTHTRFYPIPVTFPFDRYRLFCRHVRGICVASGNVTLRMLAAYRSVFALMSDCYCLSCRAIAVSILACAPVKRSAVFLLAVAVPTGRDGAQGRRRRCRVLATRPVFALLILCAEHRIELASAEETMMRYRRGRLTQC